MADWAETSSNRLLKISFLTACFEPRTAQPKSGTFQVHDFTSEQKSHLLRYDVEKGQDNPFSTTCQGTLGDAMNALMCGAGHNLRKILSRLMFFCAQRKLDFAALIDVLLMQSALQGF